MIALNIIFSLSAWVPAQIGIVVPAAEASGELAEPKLVLANWSQPQDAAPQEPQGAANLEGEVIEVEPAKSISIDLKSQTLTAMENGVPVLKFHCSTGRNNGTPPGDWPVKQKLRWNVALPEYHSVPIPYSLRLDIVYRGERYRIAIHAHNSVPNYPASHGCIRLRYPDAKKLFDWAEVGIVVNIK